MLDISGPQYRMLRKIKKGKVTKCSSLNEEELAICQYLVDHNCLASRSFPQRNVLGENSVVKALPPDLKITQTGEAQLYVFGSKFRKWWIAIVISALSLLVSIIALVLG